MPPSRTAAARGPQRLRARIHLLDVRYLRGHLRRFHGRAAAAAAAAQSRLRGSDLRYNLEISLEEAFAGRTVEIDVPTLVTCDTCDGSGAKPGTGMSTCRHCNGHGKVRAAQGFFTIERTCPVCQGRGQMMEQPCTDCGGQGRRQENRTLSVDIPKGIEDGTRIRLADEGEAGLRGGPPGDLYIFISVKPHDLFHRDGADLYARVPIAMTTAALGGEFEVPTLDAARARVKVAPGTQPGQRVRLEGQGHADAADQGFRRPLRAARRRDAAEPLQAAARAARGVRTRIDQGQLADLATASSPSSRACSTARSFP